MSGVAKPKPQRDAAEATVEPWMPDPEECENEPPYVFQHDPNERVVVSLTTHVTRIVAFAVTQQTRASEEQAWHDVVRIDSAHGTVHLHRFNQRGIEFGRKVLQPINDVGDVEVGYRQAEDLVFDEWQENLRRWRRGH